MRLLICSALLLTILCSPALGQTWSKRLNTGNITAPNDVTVTTLDQTVVLQWGPSGTSILTWLDASGVFRQQAIGFNALSVSPRLDGGIYLVGRDQVTLEMCAGAMDANGAWLWQWRIQGTTDSETLESVASTPDGGAVAIGWRYLSAGVDYEMIVYRLDPNGSILWSRRLGDAQAGDHVRGYDVDVFPDGKIAVCGQGNGGNVALLEGNGTVIWSRKIEGVNNVNVAAAQNGRVAVASDSYLMTFLPDGTLAWQREYTSLGTEMRTIDCVAIPGGGFLISGASKGEGPGINRAVDMRLTEDGDVLWRHVSGQGPSSNYQGSDAHATPSGDLVVAVYVTTGAHLGASAWAYRMTGDGTIDSCELSSVPTQVTTSNVVVSPLTDFSWFNFIEATEISSYSVAPDPWTAPDHCKGDGIGSRYCDPAFPNSSGFTAVMAARGSDDLADNDVTLRAYQLPMNQWGMFVTGMGSGTLIPGGSQGQLCLTGNTIYRFASSVLNSGPQGSFELVIDVNAIPGLGAIQAGQTWNFQAWFRDTGGTSNFTDALSIWFF